MEKQLRLFDTVALTQDLPDSGLCKGQVGTVVETLSSDVYEVEFSDDEGQAYAIRALRSDQLMALFYGYSKVA